MNSTFTNSTFTNSTNYKRKQLIRLIMSFAQFEYSKQNGAQFVGWLANTPPIVRKAICTIECNSSLVSASYSTVLTAVIDYVVEIEQIDD